MPLTIPFTASLPSGPASKVMGGAACNGPVIEGVGSGTGAGAGDGDWLATGACCGVGPEDCCENNATALRKLKKKAEIICSMSRKFIRVFADVKSPAPACIYEYYAGDDDDVSDK
jgi:hypothetical protein